ncbi:MAG: HAMP domain-containing sensor histidine kinase [Cyanobacteria bacterium P01_D01_bin.105]
MDTPDLQLAYQRLLALERFKSGFLARTSHELRSPINTIVSLSQLILEDLCEGPEEEKEFVAQSKDAALKMLALFDQIAAVSKLDIGREPAKLENVDLSFLLPEVEMLTTLQAANQNVRYTVDAPTDEVEIVTDAKWLKNILTSLIQDAIAHTKTLWLGIERQADKVVIFVESDRPAQALKTELENIEALPPISEVKNVEDIRLSTGLILATAQTALPLIEGEFAIMPLPEERSRLSCTFTISKP